MTHKRDHIESLLDLFPQAASKTLAEIARRDEPLLWDSVEQARTYIRRMRGVQGKRNRKVSTNKRHYRALKQPGDPFGKLPEGRTEFDDWGSVQFDGPRRVLIVGDIHCPYHDQGALTLALNYGRDHGADTVLLNGDVLDCYAVSSWQKDPRERDFGGELAACRDMLSAIRSGFPDALIVYKIGNHEERLERYYYCKAPELLGVAEFELSALLRFKDNDIRCVGEMRPIRLGRLNVVHGHEYRFAVSNPVNPGRGTFLRAFANTVCGHFHQRSMHSERSLEGKVISCWSHGCLCDLHPAYRPLNKWSHGFAFVEIAADGAFGGVENMLIKVGVIYR